MAQRMYWLSSTGSTNDVAAHLAELGAAEGTTVVAEAQTSGRGRHGREWFSPAGAGSVRLGHSPAFERSAAGEEAQSGGAADARERRRHCRRHPQRQSGLPVEIKWPNDVMIGRRKLAGILAEAAAQAGVLQFIVLGFGINLHAAAYPAELAARATSIEAETGRSPDRALVLAEILASVAERYADLRAARFDAILSAWRRLAPSAAICSHRVGFSRRRCSRTRRGNRRSGSVARPRR